MKNITTIIAALLIVGITGINAQVNTQVKFNNSNEADPIGEISVTPTVGELHDANVINIYSYGRTIFVKTNDIKGTINIGVYNAVGQLVYSEKNVGNDYNVNLSSDLPRGVYLVRVQAGEISVTRKVFVR